MSDQLQAGQSAPDAVVQNAQGQSVSLSEFWPNGPTLLTFLRHFGCPFCREWLTRLEQHKDQIAAIGLQTAAVGMGTPRHIERHCTRLAPNTLCFVADEQHSAYYAYGLHRGKMIGEVVSFDALKAGVRAYTHGHVNGRVIGDSRMMPGTFVISQIGRIECVHYARHSGDHPNLEHILEVAQHLALY